MTATDTLITPQIEALLPPSCCSTIIICSSELCRQVPCLNTAEIPRRRHLEIAHSAHGSAPDSDTSAGVSRLFSRPTAGVEGCF